MGLKKAEIIKGDLVLTLDVNKDPQPSGSGKTLVVASTGGNVDTGLKIDNKPLMFGGTGYIYPTDKKPKAKKT